MQLRTDPILKVSADARDFIVRQRPELADAFDGPAVAIAPLLVTAANPPAAQFEGRTMSNPSRIGDRLATLFEDAGIAALVHRLARGRDCGCAGRQAWLNRHGLRSEFALWALTALLWSIWLLK